MLTPLQRQIMIFLSAEALTGRELCQEIYSGLPNGGGTRGHQAAITRQVWRLADKGMIVDEMRDGIVTYKLTAKGHTHLERFYDKPLRVKEV